MNTPTRAQIIAGAAATIVSAPHVVLGQTPEKIRIAGVPTDDMTNIFYAIKSGMYQKAGLDVETVTTPTGAVATEAVISGTYEIGKGSLIAVLLAHLKGLPITIIGNGNVWNPKAPFSLMLVPADSPVKTGADLNGQTLGVASLNDINSLAMNAWIDKNGGDSRTIKWVEIPNSAGGTALAQHRIAATMLQEPALSAALATGTVRVLAPAYSAISDHFAITVYFAQPDWAAQHSATIKKWTRVTYDAAAYTNTHHAETAAMMAEVTKIPFEIISKMSRNTSATNTDPAAIQSCIDLAAKYKNIPRAFPAKEAYFSG